MRNAAPAGVSAMGHIALELVVVLDMSMLVFIADPVSILAEIQFGITMYLLQLGL